MSCRNRFAKSYIILNGKFADLIEKITSLTNFASKFEGTLKERDKAHTAEMELEREKREKLEALVMTMQQQNYGEVLRQRCEKGSETRDVDQPFAQPDKRITGAGGAEESVTHVDIISKDTQLPHWQLDEDTEMHDNSTAESKWKVRSGKDRYRYASDSDNCSLDHNSLLPMEEDDPEFFLDNNGEMKLVVSDPLCEIDYTLTFWQENEHDYLSPPIPFPHKNTRPRLPKFAYHKVNWDASRNSQRGTSIIPAASSSTSRLSPSATPGPTMPTNDTPVHLSDLHTLVQNMTSSITQSLMQVVQGTAIGTPKRHIVVSKKVKAEATRRTKEPSKAALLVCHNLLIIPT